MRPWLQSVLTSTLVSGVVGGAVGLYATSAQIEQERHGRQGEAAYEELIKANALLRTMERVQERAERERTPELLAEARKLKRESDAAYVVAQHRIATYGDKRVVAALSEYYREHGGANRPCPDQKKFTADVATYRSIRQTLGVGGGWFRGLLGDVSDGQLATVLFQCSLSK